MGQLHDTTVAYFRATKNYFWRWAEEGQVIEWNGAETICYKEELLIDLSQMRHHLPPLGPFLLVITLGKPSANPQVIQASMHQYVQQQGFYANGDKRLSEAEIETYKIVITNFLDLLRPLPGRYWKGPDRELLLNTLFEPIQTFFQGETAKEMLAILKRGAYDYVIAHDTYEDTRSQLEADVKSLERILQQYPDAATLENKLNSIVTQTPPEPAPMEFPVDLPKLTQTNDLLQILADDEQTAPLALLTQRLIAALHLPMHTTGYSETFVGGVSDITNKGNFDRLLLSELAQEEDTLMARLANNEALYLRREELPDNEPGQRFILVDKSIKTWGTPHILEMAAALACAIDNKQHAEILSFALLGDSYQPIILSSKEEIIASMQFLSPALHSAVALSAFTNDHSLNGRQEYFLITEDELFLTPSFQHSFAALRKTDGFVITVNRNGRIHLYRYTAGHRKLLSTAKINLDMPSAQPKPRQLPIQQKQDWTGFPAFLQTRPFPLFIPQQLSNLGQRHCYFVEGAGGLAITKHRQLLFWGKPNKGAIEITANFPDAHSYFFGLDDEFFYIFFQAKGSEQLSLYHFNRSTLELSTQEIKYHESVQSIRRNGVSHAPFKNGTFLICIAWPSNIISVNARSGVMNLTTGLTQEMLIKMTEGTSKTAMYKHWESYNTINTLKRLEINDRGKFVLNKHEFTFLEKGIELIKTDHETTLHLLPSTEKQVQLPDSRQSITKFTWSDGSEAWFDHYRHMLHLRSSNKLLTEVTIVLIVNQYAACWAADGSICGSSYFRVDEQKVVDGMTFHEKYIKPFIQVIQQHGTAAVI